MLFGTPRAKPPKEGGADPENWPLGIAVAVRDLLESIAAEPDSGRMLTTEAIATGRTGVREYDLGVTRLGGALVGGRALLPSGVGIPTATETFVLRGLASMIAQRLDGGRRAELPAMAAVAAAFLLSPYLGPKRARDAALAGVA